MRLQLRRALAIAAVVVFAAIVAMAIAGWIVVATSNNPGHTRFAVTVVNDRPHSLAIQPCGRFDCSSFAPVEVSASSSYTWHTTDGDASIHSFVVAVSPSGRVLGCLAQQGLNPVGHRAVVRVSELEECVT